MSERIVQDVAIERIIRPPQLRERRSEADRLALRQSVKQNGILVPCLGHAEGSAIAVDEGYGRVDAAEYVGLRSVPMIVSDHAPTAAERLVLQLVANTLRSDLTVMEKSRAYDRLIRETAVTASEVALKCGSSPATISRLLALQVLPRTIQDFIDAGRIPMSSAYAIATVPDAAERERLIQEVLDGRLTRDKLVAKTKVSRSARGVSRPRKPRQVRRERVVIPLGEGRSVSVTGPTLSVESVIAWLSDLLDRIRTAGAEGCPLSDVVKTVSIKKK
jgi:ParB/RepB/Spo0J family partition protein